MSTRYTVLLDEVAAREHERLRKAYKLKTKADLYVLGVQVLDWILDQQAKGYEIGRFKDDQFNPLLIPKGVRS